MKYLKLAKNFSISATEYAIQANGDLGIRDSGKTYTAMKAAEQLLIAKIPITVLDPSGVWKNIRHGVNGKKGFPVIVAGGDSSADIILTADNAAQIVRAAIKSGVSIIFDLYSKNLANKSTWNRIVHDIMEVLMYENETLRHIFLEEAAEFAPQRIMPQQTKVYSSIERVVRIGRNASLGITIINQRAEEINKAILELCALVFLHKQVGKNSLLSIKKWFDVIGWDKNNVSQMVTQLPTFNKGECLIVQAQDVTGGVILKSHILPKQTFHPSPEKNKVAKSAKSNTNISKFIKKINDELNKVDKLKQAKFEIKTHVTKLPKNFIVPDPEAMKNKEAEIQKMREELRILQKDGLVKYGYIYDLKTEINEYKKQLDIAKKEIEALQISRISISAAVSEFYGSISNVIKLKPLPSKVNYNIPSTVFRETTNKADKSKRDSGAVVKASTNNTQVDLKQMNVSGAKDSALNRMIKAVSMFPGGINKPQLALLIGMAPTSGTFGEYYRRLVRSGVVAYSDNKFYPTEHTRTDMADISISISSILDRWRDILGRSSGMTRILDAVQTGNMNKVPMAEIEQASNMSASSGTFGEYKRRLRRYGLIDISKDGLKLSHNLIMPGTHIVPAN